jgi:hypothetical protein
MRKERHLEVYEYFYVISQLNDMLSFFCNFNLLPSKNKGFNEVSPEFSKVTFGGDKCLPKPLLRNTTRPHFFGGLQRLKSFHDTE